MTEPKAAKPKAVKLLKDFAEATRGIKSRKEFSRNKEAIKARNAWSTFASNRPRLSSQSYDEIAVSGIDFSDCYILAVSFKSMEFSNCNFTGATLDGVNASFSTSFNDCDFKSARLLRSIFCVSYFNDCDLSGASIEKSQIKSVGMRRCNLEGALLGADFWNSRFSNSSFLGAQGNEETGLDHVSFKSCLLSAINLSGMSFSSLVLRECQIQGADFSGAKFLDTLFTECDLMGSDFSGSELRRSEFSTSNLETALFHSVKSISDFPHPVFVESNVDSASFPGAKTWQMGSDSFEPFEWNVHFRYCEGKPFEVAGID